MNYTSLHCNVIYFAVLQIAVNCTSLHCSELYCTPLHLYYTLSALSSNFTFLLLYSALIVLHFNYTACEFPIECSFPTPYPYPYTNMHDVEISVDIWMHDTFPPFLACTYYRFIFGKPAQSFINACPAAWPPAGSSFSSYTIPEAMLYLHLHYTCTVD